MQDFYTRRAEVFRKSLTEIYGVPCVVTEWDDYVREIRPMPADAPQTIVAAPVEEEEEEEDLYGEMPAQVPTNPTTPMYRKLTVKV